MKRVTVVNAKRRNANLLVWKVPVALIMVVAEPVAVVLMRYALRDCARALVLIRVIHSASNAARSVASLVVIVQQATRAKPDFVSPTAVFLLVRAAMSAMVAVTPVGVVKVRFVTAVTNALKAVPVPMFAAKPSVARCAVLRVAIVTVPVAPAWFAIQVFVLMMEFVSRTVAITPVM
jgi:hypothetical protein